MLLLSLLGGHKAKGTNTTTPLYKFKHQLPSIISALVRSYSAACSFFEITARQHLAAFCPLPPLPAARNPDQLVLLGLHPNIDMEGQTGGAATINLSFYVGTSPAVVDVATQDVMVFAVKYPYSRELPHAPQT